VKWAQCDETESRVTESRNECPLGSDKNHGRDSAHPVASLGREGAYRPGLHLSGSDTLIKVKTNAAEFDKGYWRKITWKTGRGREG